MRSSTIGSSSCHRTWGIEPQEFNTDAFQMSKCQEHAMGSWKGVCAYRGDIWLEEDSKVILKSSFFLRSQKIRILRGYCRDGMPRRVYLVMGLVRGHSIVRGQVNARVVAQASEWAKRSSFKVPRSMFEDRFHLGLTGQRSKGLA